MNKDTIQSIFTGVLLAGLILLAGGVYLLALQVETVSKSIQRIERDAMEAGQKTEDAMMKEDSVLRQTEPHELTLAEAETNLSDLLALQDRGGFNSKLDFQTLVPRYKIIDGLQIAFPYDQAWGGPSYTIPAYELIEKQVYHFGPMTLSEFYGPYRAATLRVVPLRSLEEALRDERYISKDCGGSTTFTPVVTTIPSSEYPGPRFDRRAVRFEGEACEAVWVGYEVMGRTSNFVFTSGPEANDELLQWVISRSFDLVGN
jgi:hypothetical protein